MKTCRRDLEAEKKRRQLNLRFSCFSRTISEVSIIVQVVVGKPNQSRADAREADFAVAAESGERRPRNLEKVANFLRRIVTSLIHHRNEELMNDFKQVLTELNQRKDSMS
jgi:hypothetical protein